MADAFAELLHEAALDGITFPVSSREVKGGRSFGRHRFPFRDGQITEPTGREPYTFELTCPLYATTDVANYPDLWPGRWEELRHLLEDPEKGGEFEYTDPVYGPIPVIVSDWQESSDAERRNGITLHLTIEERQLDERIERPEILVFADRDARGQAESLATEVDSGLANANISDDDLASAFADAGVPLTDNDPITEGRTFFSLVDEFGDALDEGAIAQDEIAARLDALRSRIDAVMSFDPMISAANWSTVIAAQQLIASCTDMAERASAKAPPVEDYYVADEKSVYDISAELYGTPARANDILTRNRIPNPLFIPAGTVLRVLSPT